MCDDDGGHVFFYGPIFYAFFLVDMFHDMR